MAWHRPGDKPLFVPMMVSLLTYICVTRPQWVECWNDCSAFQITCLETYDWHHGVLRIIQTPWWITLHPLHKLHTVVYIYMCISKLILSEKHVLVKTTKTLLCIRVLFRLIHTFPVNSYITYFYICQVHLSISLVFPTWSPFYLIGHNCFFILFASWYRLSFWQYTFTESADNV